MTVNFLAPIVAPVLGGQSLTFTSWRGGFVTLALIGVVALLAAAFGLRETLPADSRQGGGLSASLSEFRKLLADHRFVGYALTGGFAFAAGITYISVSPFVLPKRGPNAPCLNRGMKGLPSPLTRWFFMKPPPAWSGTPCASLPRLGELAQRQAKVPDESVRREGPRLGSTPPQWTASPMQNN